MADLSEVVDILLLNSRSPELPCFNWACARLIRSTIRQVSFALGIEPNWLNCLFSIQLAPLFRVLRVGAAVAVNPISQLRAMP